MSLNVHLELEIITLHTTIRTSTGGENMDSKEKFTIILNEIRESNAETKKQLDTINNRLESMDNRLDSTDNRLENLERELNATKQLVQNFRWDIDLLTDKQAKTEMAVNRLEKKLENLTIHN